ncbi:MAG: hypothetical protein OEZ22_14950 [Spirochaetia bacterium]|nr:hypothetical protein [Spirochaetia bacterium]
MKKIIFYMLVIIFNISCSTEEELTVPQDLIVEIQTTSNILNIQWAEVSAASHYTVQVYLSEETGWTNTGINIKDTIYHYYLDEKRVVNMAYENIFFIKFRVKAIDSEGNASEWSDEVMQLIEYNIEPNPPIENGKMAELVKVSDYNYRVKIYIKYTGNVILDSIGLLCFIGYGSSGGFNGYDIPLVEYNNTQIFPNDEIIIESEVISSTDNDYNAALCDQIEYVSAAGI